MRAMYNKVIAAAGILLAATAALAEPDTFYLGTGRDGALDASARETVINRYAQVRSPLAPGDLVIQVNSAEGFAAGDLVMVLQTTGLVPLAQPGSSGPMDLTQDPVGRWELARLALAGKAELYLAERLVHSYAAEVTQIIRVPEYTTVHIRSGASITARAWDGATGGVIAFLANGTVTNEGAIDASGMGFRGGAYVQQSRASCSPGAWKSRGARRGEGVDSTDYGQGMGRANIANGGGGGACLPSGGGGGGNGGPGGQGGQPLEGPRDAGGMGGIRLLYSLRDHLTLGGGGGGGSGLAPQEPNRSTGGRGGGSIFIRAGALTGQGALLARGEAGRDSDSQGAGGGGAGGSISVRVAGLLECSRVDASGGAGGRAESVLAAGGGGGGGRVLYQAGQASHCAVAAWASEAGQGREFSSGAQPTPATRLQFAGVITQLDGGLVFPGLATVLWPEAGARVTTRLPTIQGTAPVGSEVVIFLDGSEVGRTIAEGGFFELPLTTPLVEGLHQVQAAAVYQGLLGYRSAWHPFLVSTKVASSAPTLPPEEILAPPGAPTLTRINSTNYTADMRVNVLRPDMEGTCEATATAVSVTLTTGGNSAPVTVTRPSPTSWRATPNQDLTGGAGTLYTLSVTASNADGTSPATTGRFVVDTQALAPVIDSPAQGAYVNIRRPTISGTAEASSSVTVEINGDAQAPVTANASGGWTFTPASDLSIGFNWVRARIRDTAGNTSSFSMVISFFVDVTAPAAPVVTAPATGQFLNTRSPVVRGTAEPGSTVTVSINGASQSPAVLADATGSWIYADLNLGEGLYRIRATATDAAGNNSPLSTESQFTIDLTAPDTTITTNVPRFTNNTNLRIEFSSEVGATFECSLNNAPFAACTSPRDLSSLTNGDYVFLVRARDRAGNVDPTPDDLVWTVDTQAPAAPVLNIPAAGLLTNNPTPTITGTAEAGARIDVYRSGTLVSSRVTADTDGNWSFTPTAAWTAGQYAITATATDAAGNTSPVSVSRDITLDLTPPDTAITSGPPLPPDVHASRDAQFVFSVAGGTESATFECSVDGAAYITCRSPYSLSNVTDGLHIISVRARDLAGNVDPTPASRAWLVDATTRLTLSVTRSPPTLGNSLDFRFEFNTNRNATLTCRHYRRGATPLPSLASCNNQGSNRQGTYSGTLTSQGPYRFEVVAQDGTNTERVFVDWDVDTDAPAPPTITSPAAGTRSRSLLVTVEGRVGTSQLPESGATVELFVGGVSRGTATTGDDGIWRVLDVAVSPDGEYQLSARATDRAGNRGAASSPITLIVDTIPPVTQILTMPSVFTRDSSVTFTFGVATGTGGGTISYFCKFETPDFVPCGSPWVSPPRTLEQAYTLEVLAQDEAGNRDQTPEVYTWNLDRTAPETIIDARPDSVTSEEVVYFAFRSNEIVSKFWCKLDSNPEYDCTNSAGRHPVEARTAGSHTFSVWAVDRAGNRGDTPATWTWRLDKDIPDVTIVGGCPPAVTSSTEAEFRFASTKAATDPGLRFQCNLNRRGFAQCSQVSIFSVRDGDQSLVVKAVDSLDRETPAGDWKSCSWRVDTLPPETVITRAPPRLTNQVTFRFEFGAQGERDAPTFECDLDGAGFTLCARVHDVTVASGQHTLLVRAIDSARNVDPQPARAEWSVDLIPPAAPVLQLPPGESWSRTGAPRFNGTVNEGLSTVKVQVGGQDRGLTTADAQGNWSLALSPALSDGEYLLDFQAVDEAGNPGPKTEPLRVFIDTQPPVTSIIEGAEGRIREPVARFRFGSDEEDSSFECSLQGSEFTSCEETTTFSNLREGDYTLWVRAVDRAGNPDETYEVRRWRVYLGGDSQVIGGGLGCSTAGGGSASLVLLAVARLAWCAARRRPRRPSEP